MMLRNIDALRNISLRFRYECFVILGTIVFVSIYIFSLNRNLLYLSFLGAFYIFSSALFTRFREMFIGLAMCVFLGVAPANIPGVKFIDPAPNTVTFIENYQVRYASLNPLEIWQYVFPVNGLERHQMECGGNLQGRLLIDGIDLSGLEINIGGDASAGSAQIIPKYVLDHIQMPITIGVSREVVVLLNARTGMSPKIYLGPEAHGFDIYSDAVWLEFKNEQCAVLYHAQRRVIPAQSGMENQ